MAQPLLDQIHSQIRARVREFEPAVREAERLAAALAAIDGLGTATFRAGKPEAAAATTIKPQRRRAATASRSRPKRAPRGANRAAVLGVLEQRPGVTASELSASAGVAKPVLYALLKTLQESGEVAKEQLPGGSAGYRLASTAPSTGTDPAPSPGNAA